MSVAFFDGCRLTIFAPVAEFRGPGVHHNFDDSDSGYNVETEQRTQSFGIGGYRGRIIFLGDGSEVLTDSDDTEMFDQEDKDLDSQVSKAAASSDDETAEEKEGDEPEKHKDAEAGKAAEAPSEAGSAKTDKPAAEAVDAKQS